MTNQVMDKEIVQARLEDDFRALRNDFETLRTDLRSDVGNLRTDLSKVVRDGYSALTQGALDQGRHAAEAVEHRLEERPIVAVMLAFGFGLGVGLLATRGRSRATGA